jgi:hypothetical protein
MMFYQRKGFNMYVRQVERDESGSKVVLQVREDGLVIDATKRGRKINFDNLCEGIWYRPNKFGIPTSPYFVRGSGYPSLRIAVAQARLQY